MLKIQDLAVEVGAFSLKGFSLEIAQGECVALMGPSGCGKTTVMEAVCGLRKVSSGQIYLNEREITVLAPGARGIGFVPQDVALFPTMTVREQLGFGPRLHGWDTTLRQERVEFLAAQLGIESLLDRGPRGLSGGEARRVALGRALALKPQLLCLDEALTGLDETLHEEVLQVIESMIRSEGVTVLLVTHSRKEAEWLAGSIVKMKKVN